MSLALFAGTCLPLWGLRFGGFCGGFFGGGFLGAGSVSFASTSHCYSPVGRMEAGFTRRGRPTVGVSGEMLIAMEGCRSLPFFR
jgi:hypothetical protein